MALIGGVYQPGADAHSVTGVVADNLSFIAAASGRRIVGFSSKGTDGTSSGGFAGALCLGEFAYTTMRAVQWAYTTNETAEGWFWPGIDCSNGVSIDWVGGSQEIVVHTIDVT
jgi:hypothetical protein